MGRTCAECGEWCEKYEFSSNQWRKGEYVSKCSDCVSAKQQPVQCPHCYGTFSSQNALEMHLIKCQPTCYECGRTFRRKHDLDQHMKVHRAKNVSCPVCGVQRFASGADAVAHVESGYCDGCQGKDNARRQIYGFARAKAPHFLTDVPLIEDIRDGSFQVPDKAYRCGCGRTFRDLSSMMNHQADSSRCSSRGDRMLGW